MEHQHSKTHTDLVCGMQTNEDSQYHDRFKGMGYYFCSQHCLDKFKADPESYLTTESSDSVDTDATDATANDHSCCHGEHHHHSHLADSESLLQKRYKGCGGCY